MLDGPPSMNRKMTLLARGGKCGGLGASGFAAAGGCANAGLSRNRYESARAPKPAPPRSRSSRRFTIDLIGLCMFSLNYFGFLALSPALAQIPLLSYSCVFRNEFVFPGRYDLAEKSAR